MLFGSAVGVSRAWLLVASVVLLPGAGCMHTGPARQTDSSEAGAREAIQSDQTQASASGRGADPYLALLERFNTADADQREAIYEKATVAAALKASAEHRLELALLKLSSGHSGYNPAAAETLLESVMTDTDGLSAGAVSLAASYLRLVREYNHLKSANAALQDKLTEARDKIDALTEIEQTVNPGDKIPAQSPEVPLNDQ